MCEVDELVIVSFCDDYNVFNGVVDRLVLKLFGNFVYVSGCVNEVGMGYGIVVFDFFEDFVDVDGIVKVLVVEVWGL